MSVLQPFRSSFNDQHMGLLAAVISDMDKEFPHLEDTSLSDEFSSALSKFTHNLIANNMLSDALQVSVK